MIYSPNFSILKETYHLNSPEKITDIFHSLIDELKGYLNLELINKNFKIHTIDKNIKNSGDITSYGVKRYLEENIYHLELNKAFNTLFPFILLQSSYLMFIPDDLKETKFIEYAINQFVEINLQEFDHIEEWEVLIREKSIHLHFRFDKFFNLKDNKSSISPLQFFFQYIRQYPNIDFDEDLIYILEKIYKEFLFKTSKRLHSNEIAETLRILTKIFYNVKDCDTLQVYYKYFKLFKNQGFIQTNLSFRKFKNSLQWINRFSRITPTYYFDWKSLDIAYLACYFKFNPLLEKSKIDKIVKQMPFLIMPRLSIDDSATELSAYFVVPRVYLNELKYLFEKIEQRGYIIEKNCSIATKYVFSINLNYFREFHSEEQFVDLKNKDYSKVYELEFEQEYSKDFHRPNLTLLDFLILDRIRFFSYVGFTFSRKTDIANIIKSDWINFYTSETRIIKEMRKTYKTLIKSPEIQQEFLEFLINNQNYGFFYVKNDLEKWVKYFHIIEKESKGKTDDIDKFKDFYEKENILKIIEENELFDDLDSSSKKFKNLFLSYLNDRENYEKEVNKFRFYFQFLEMCSALKIFSIFSVKRLISNPELIENIADIKENRLKDIKERDKVQYVTSTSINQRITNLIKKKIIKPYLIDSIWRDSLARYFPQMILKNSPEVRVIIDKIKHYFPKVYYYESIDLFNQQKYIYFQLFVPFLKDNEKTLLVSALSNLFKENILFFKRFSWDGFLHTFSRKDFYDFENRNFFYTRDLFDQYFLFVRRIFGEEFNTTQKETIPATDFWSVNTDLSTLLKTIRQRIESETTFNLTPNDAQKLVKFNLNLEKNLLEKQKLRLNSKELFYKRYIKEIKFFPAFQKFGLGQYILFINPLDLSGIDLKLLFSNTFQKVKKLASIDSTNLLLIKYIFPFNDPNKSYLNWLAKSKKNIREYCLFYIKSISQIFNFNNNFGSKGWSLDPNKFKAHIQNVLFNPNYNINGSEAKNFNVGDLVVSDYYKPNSPHFNSLKQLYNWKSVDVMENLDTMTQSTFDKIRNLIKEKLVYPYINFKNLDFKEKIHIFLLNLEENTKDTLKAIFQFFNLSYIYDIEGEYYIYGYKKQKKVKNGLMIKLYLPDCELSEILRILEYIFQYLKVERYLILTDLVDGKNLLKTVYGRTDFLKHYNPLQNLIWMAENNKWKNHRLFTDDFEYVYPELIFKKQ